MTLARWSLIFGAVYALVGILGFVPGLVTSPEPHHATLAIEHSYGLLLGLFPVNLPHNLFHLAIGLWGLAAARALTASRLYFRSLAWIYGVLAIMGLFPALNTTFGLIPIFGHDVWLHALTAAAAAYFGYAYRAGSVRRRTATAV